MSFYRDADQAFEPAPAPEVFVSGLERIEPVGGGNFRFVLYSNHLGPDGSSERHIVLNVIVPGEALPDAVAKTMAIMGEKDEGAPSRKALM